MPTTFDISQSPQNTPGPSSSGPKSRGTGTRFDDYARTILWIALFVTGALLVYVGYGLFANVWTNPTYHGLDHASRERHLNNIGMVITAMRISSIIAIISMSICSFRDEGIGYVLSGAAAILYLGIPYATVEIFAAQSVGPSDATNLAVQGLQSLWWIYGGPGVLFVLIDMGRRFQAASENAAIQKANLKYGSNINKVTTKGQKFLGRCWELPYCREHVRAKCPIFLRRRGPCWWYKEGCMCEERIVLQAVIAQDWKEQAAAATQKIGLTGAPAGGGIAPLENRLGLSANAPKQILSPSAKRDRCRKCIIYNEHQRQKYKLWVAVALVAIPTLLILFKDVLQAAATFILTKADIVTKQFQLTPGQPDDSMLRGANGEILQNILIFCLGLVIVSQVLKLVEYMVLKLKL